MAQLFIQHPFELDEKEPKAVTKRHLIENENDYLVGGHVRDRPVSLHAFQLVQTPIKLLQGLHSCAQVRFV